MKKNLTILLLMILFVNSALAKNKEITIDINDMTCTLCAIAINKSLRSTDGVVKAKASLKTHQAVVIVPDEFDNNKLLEAISQTGYNGKINSISLE